MFYLVFKLFSVRGFHSTIVYPICKLFSVGGFLRQLSCWYVNCLASMFLSTVIYHVCKLFSVSGFSLHVFIRYVNCSVWVVSLDSCQSVMLKH